MKLLFRLGVLLLLVVLGGVAFIRYTYNCSWQESFDIADELLNDLLG